jgi:hypothetical protein
MKDSDYQLYCFRSQNYFYTAWGSSLRDAADRLDKAGKIHATLRKTFVALPVCFLQEHQKMMEGDVSYRAKWGGGPEHPKLKYWSKYLENVASRPDILAQFLQGETR